MVSHEKREFKMIKYKILREINGKILSPYKGFEYKIGKEYVCENFDDNPKNDCSRGFYATDIKGLLYRNLSRRDEHVYEAEVSGRSVNAGFAKTRYEKQTIIRKMHIEEIKALCLMENYDFDVYHALFPVNPCDIEFGKITDADILNLKKWDSVRDSVEDSVRTSVRDSVEDSVKTSVEDSIRDSVRASIKDSIKDSVWGSVRTSVWASVWAYISSLFPNIKKWNYIEHKEGENPFQSGIDLWHRGLIPFFDGNYWRLYSAKDRKIVFTISKKELEIFSGGEL